MPVSEPQRGVPWTTTGLVVGILAVLFAMVGGLLAVQQAGASSAQLLDGVHAEALLLNDAIRNATVRQTTAALRAAAAPGGGAAPTPGWVRAAYVFDGAVLTRVSPSAAEEDRTGADRLELIRRRATARWQHAVADPLGDRAVFYGDESAGEPVLIANVALGATEEPLRVVVGDLDAARLWREVLAPLLGGAAGRIESVRSGQATDRAWRVSLAPVLPFWSLVPTADFMQELRRSFRWQVGVQVIVIALPLAGLLGVMGALMRVARREMALSRTKSAFVADVSHELKTPLALIRMFGETLLAGRVPSEEKGREYYAIITRESTRLTHLIDNLLDFSRVDAGRKVYKLQPVDVGQIVRDTYDAYRHELEREHFEHSLTLAERLPPIEADADAVAQALLNLMSNAVKYSEQDKFLAIDVAHETRRGRRGVLISVQDRGIGIRSEDRARLFDGFFRAADERVRKRRGAGLGLALVKHIVDAHQGSIDVESRLVKGSTFRIFLPAAGQTPARKT